MYNPNFKGVDFDAFKKDNYNFSMSPSKWIQSTKAISGGIISKRGRYASGTYAHKDIAMEFLTWLSPTFKLYVIQEFQRLKEKELKTSNLQDTEWQTRRSLSKTNYQLQTYAIKHHILNRNSNGDSALKNPGTEYASEADLLNEVVFKSTAEE